MFYFIFSCIGLLFSLALALSLHATDAVPIIIALFFSVVPIYVELHDNHKDKK